ncbi:MAG: NAD(P)-dependent alcohol dehydrogenase [Ilumatobacter sp.]|nr:NAD(P)-dependent alcohol dehydrogenase [Ilumatobacter sp.]
MPVVGAEDVLVRVRATSLNLSDWECLIGSPAYSRVGGRRRVLGSDIAGTVEAIGAEVTRFAVGDEVYGDNLGRMGGFAELATAPESVLAHKPSELTFVQASTLPQAGAIAVQGTALAAPGRRMLINGAGGGSGSFAIQLAKAAGAEVVAVDNAEKLDFMRSLGADEVVDYRVRDVTRDRGSYDVVLDMVAHRNPFAYRRMLAPAGTYRCAGGSVPALLGVATVGAVAAKATRRSVGVLMVKTGPERFGPLAAQCVSGEVDIHIDRTFALDEVPDALRYLGEGHALGKVVVEIP